MQSSSTVSILRAHADHYRCISVIQYKISHTDRERVPKPNTAVKPHCNKVTVMRFGCEDTQASKIAGQITDLVMSTTLTYGDVAIIMRTNSLLKSFETLFAKSNVPYYVVNIHIVLHTKTQSLSKIQNFS